MVHWWTMESRLLYLPFYRFGTAKMVDYADSSQLNLWLFPSVEELEYCRSLANQKAREYLLEREKKLSDQEPSDSTAEDDASDVSARGPLPVWHFACGYSQRKQQGVELGDEKAADDVPEQTAAGHPFLTVEEEETLVSFYASRLPSLMGPAAAVSRLRRESKVLATAVMLYRRFFLSNSVMLHDPKAVMVAAAFLGSKAEDATVGMRFLKEGTSLLDAQVQQQEIVQAEIALLSGTEFHLLCFHPYKAVLALTEDLRIFIKTDKGKRLLPQEDVVIRGEDLKPMYDGARSLLDDVVVSDIPLLYSPGQIGMAALMAAQDELQEKMSDEPKPPRIDLVSYLQLRFPQQAEDWSIQDTLSELTNMLRELKQGKHGCGHYGEAADFGHLRAIHKKLKKVRAWGKKEGSGKRGKKRKKPSS